MDYDKGELVIEALRVQGFDVQITDALVGVLTSDGLRLYAIDWAIFFRNSEAHVSALRQIVQGLQLFEGFAPPDGLFE